MKTNPNEAFDKIYRIKKLKNNEKIESFDCGDEDLNDVSD